ncbi:MAG: FtsB family cell division protein [bacterium]
MKRVRIPKETKTILFILFVLCVVVFISAHNSYIESQKLAKKEKELIQLIESEKEREKEIEKQIEYYNSKEYIEDLARNKLGLVKPNEILILPEKE